MHRLLIVLISITVISCHSKRSIPDVSNIKVNLEVKRLDKDFFQMDTTQMVNSLDILQQKYGPFLNDYLYQILGVPPQQDSAVEKVKLFLRGYKPLADSIHHNFTSTDDVSKDIRRSLQFVHYYFPQYPLPKKLITFVGPIEGYANVLTNDGLAVGLQLYMGKDFPAYQTDYMRELYPQYQSRRFEPQYITVNCIQNIIDDMYPSKNGDAPLIDQIIELGKRMYVTDQLLPETADSIKIGYTYQQLEGCYNHEALIWNFFVKNDLLYTTDPILTRDYINDSPKTSALGEGAPGFIGKFVGWQIVKKWMQEQKDLTLDQMMNTPPRKIYEEAKYKPR